MFSAGHAFKVPGATDTDRQGEGSSQGQSRADVECISPVYLLLLTFLPLRKCNSRVDEGQSQGSSGDSDGDSHEGVKGGHNEETGGHGLQIMNEAVRDSSK